MASALLDAILLLLIHEAADSPNERECLSSQCKTNDNSGNCKYGNDFGTFLEDARNADAYGDFILDQLFRRLPSHVNGSDVKPVLRVPNPSGSDSLCEHASAHFLVLESISQSLLTENLDLSTASPGSLFRFIHSNLGTVEEQRMLFNR